MMEVDFLNTVAKVAVTLTGFIGVAFALGRRSEGGLSIHESSAVFHLLYTALGSLFLSLVASVFLASTRSSSGKSATEFAGCISCWVSLWPLRKRSGVSLAYPERSSPGRS